MTVSPSRTSSCAVPECCVNLQTKRYKYAARASLPIITWWARQTSIGPYDHKSSLLSTRISSALASVMHARARLMCAPTDGPHPVQPTVAARLHRGSCDARVRDWLLSLASLLARSSAAVTQCRKRNRHVVATVPQHVVRLVRERVDAGGGVVDVRRECQRHAHRPVQQPRAQAAPHHRQSIASIQAHSEQ